MEKEGLRRCLADLKEAGITLKSFTTDGHVAIAAYMRDEHGDVTHHLDAWHIAKSKCKLYYTTPILHNAIVQQEIATT